MELLIIVNSRIALWQKYNGGLKKIQLVQEERLLQVIPVCVNLSLIKNIGPCGRDHSVILELAILAQSRGRDKSILTQSADTSLALRR